MFGILRNASIGTKTALAFVTISVLMVAQALLAVRNMSEMTRSFHVVSESGIPSVKNAGFLTQTITELQYREYQLANASAAEMPAAREQLQLSRRKIGQRIAQAQALADTDLERSLAQLAEEQWTAYLAAPPAPEGSGSNSNSNSSTHRLDELLSTAESIVRVNTDEALDATNQADQGYRRSYDATLAVIGLVVVATLSLGWGLSRGLSRRLAKLLTMGRRIVDAGQSTLADDALDHDEIDQLSAVLGQVYESRNRSLSVSRLTHELRTPLNSILGFAELMLSERDAVLPKVHQRYIHQMVDSGKHLIRLIDDLLDLSKMEAGLAHLRLVGVDAVDVIEEARRLIEPMAREHGLRVLFRPAGGARWVQADRTRLLQVVLNLLSNAVKYNRKGGLVEIGIDEDASQRTTAITVRDEGAGIASQHRKELFKPFQRLGRESGTVQGTGLGLAISSKLVHLMHGSIQVESTPGVGSRFIVSLPTGEASLAAMTAPAVPQQTTPRQLAGTVLHVDDDETSRILMQAYFQSRPHVRFLCADSAAAGLQIARQERPDVILVDICMPQTDGFEFLRRFRNGLDVPDVRCVAVSANASNEDAEAALAAGFDGYLMKPLSMPTLFGCVDPWLGAA